MPKLLKSALAAVTMTPLLTALAMLQAEPGARSGLLYIASSLLFFGIGEIINHPVQTSCNYTENEDSELRRVAHRSRNPCALGNLLFIAGLLFLFMGLARFISF